jgi:hypothetical protein
VIVERNALGEVKERMTAYVEVFHGWWGNLRARVEKMGEG